MIILSEFSREKTITKFLETANRSNFMTAEATPTNIRLLSLDVFRGMTVAGMVLVNNPGTWSAVYSPLAHAPWHG